ncbi:family 10 glycosylhydrolase [Actinomycetes bacterium KLBMP 9797]
MALIPGRLQAPLAVALVVVVLASVGLIRWQLRSEAPPVQPATSCGGRPLDAPRQLRGMWIATVSNIDWPSRPGLDAETVKAEYRGWLDLAQRRGHNAVFVHVRPSGDAFWPSAYAPWSRWLTGRADGQGPGWDPMEYLVAEAHARNLEFHAWFNPYKAAQTGKMAELPPNHPLRQHPEWAVTYPKGGKGSRLYYNPGIPAARTYVEDSMLEAVAKYDVDGVHFDDFFYPYPVGKQDFPDDAAFQQFGAGFRTKADWRRENVNTLVREMNQRIKQVKPWVKFGISPFGIWRNRATDPLGSDTRGLQSYDAIYADTRLWVKKEWLDYLVPQLYWHIGFDVADYRKLLPWWSDVMSGTRVQLYVGQADYRVGQKGAWRDPAELDRQLALNRRYPVNGSVHFSARQVRADRLGAVSRYATNHYARPALVPAMPHLPAARPNAPAITEARRDEDGTVTLAWRAGSGPAPASYTVFIVDGDTARAVATTRDNRWVGRTEGDAGTYTYCVAALDRLWNVGGASESNLRD